MAMPLLGFNGIQNVESSISKIPPIRFSKKKKKKMIPQTIIIIITMAYLFTTSVILSFLVSVIKLSTF